MSLPLKRPRQQIPTCPLPPGSTIFMRMLLYGTVTLTVCVALLPA